MDVPIAVTDGLIGIRSGPSSRRADVFVGDHKTPGWIDYEANCPWAGAGTALVRCGFPERLRSSGHARRAVHLLLHHLATRTELRAAVLRIEPTDTGLLDVAAATGFAVRGTVSGERVLERPVPPVSYSDGVVTIRPQRVDDIDRHMEAIDDDQIDWLWEPGDRRKWEAMTPMERREHNLRHLRACQDNFGAGRFGPSLRTLRTRATSPTWTATWPTGTSRPVRRTSRTPDIRPTADKATSAGPFAWWRASCVTTPAPGQPHHRRCGEHCIAAGGPRRGSRESRPVDRRTRPDDGQARPAAPLTAAPCVLSQERPATAPGPVPDSEGRRPPPCRESRMRGPAAGTRTTLVGAATPG